MARVQRQFQIFAKPIGSNCNLDCAYCYYLKKRSLYPEDVPARMSKDLLEGYIVEHIEASTDPEIRFSWHGGEPTLLGLDYFKQIAGLQHRHRPKGRRIANCIQTNGTLIDDKWCDFFVKENFTVGLSMDGPCEFHDSYRLDKAGKPTHDQVMKGYELLRRHRVPCDILCVVNAANVRHPARVYRFFKQIKAGYLTFLPLVERGPENETGVTDRTVPAGAFGDFLCTIFDEWLKKDIGRIMIQIFEEVAGTALGKDHALCVFRKTCGDIPAIERNGDVYSCDHYVDPEHLLGNIRDRSLVELLESGAQRAFGNSKSTGLPRYCQTCDVLMMCNGGCPKDRFLLTPDGENGLNYLCAGYKRFFNRCKPFAASLSALGKRPGKVEQTTGERLPGNINDSKTGRNDPCPCGSGKKYKKCCLRNHPIP